MSPVYLLFMPNCTPSGKKMVTGVQVVTASQVQIIGCRWQDVLLSFGTNNTPYIRAQNLTKAMGMKGEMQRDK